MIDQEHLISVVREQRLLWDKRHKNYRNRLLTKKAWRNVADTLGCTSDEAQTKWKNLRDSFSRELKKIPKRQTGADLADLADYTGDWLHFEAMQFLKGVIRTRKTTANVRSNSLEETDMIDDESIMSALSNSTGISSNTDNNQTHLQSEFENFQARLATDIQFGSNHSPSTTAYGVLSPDLTPRDCLQYGAALAAESKSMKQNDFAEIFADFERHKMDLLKKEIEFKDDEDMNWFKSILPHMKKLPPLNKFLFRTKVQEMLLSELTKLDSSQPGPSTLQGSTNTLQ